MSENVFEIMRCLAPDLAEEMGRRALVLERIAVLQPVGRRALASRLCMPEREIRAVATALKAAGYITLDAAGMSLTPQAEPVVAAAREVSHAMRGLAALESSLSRTLGIPRVVVVPGDADMDPNVLHDLGRAVAQRMRGLLWDKCTLALTGGNTIAEIAHAMQPVTPPMDVLVLPARGGMGRTVESQAGTLAAEFARKLGGYYRLLHVPDQLDQAAREELRKLPEVGETLTLLRDTNVLLHGIGRADEMAQHRRLSQETRRQLTHDGAVAEAFGYYFDVYGRPVYEASCVGLDIAMLDRIDTIVAVAAGARKASAMLGVLRHHPHDLLATDEGAARALLAQCNAKAG